MSGQLPHDEELRSLYRKLPAEEPRAEVDEAHENASKHKTTSVVKIEQNSNSIFLLFLWHKRCESNSVSPGEPQLTVDVTTVETMT